MKKEKAIDTDYRLVPMHLIESEAREIAVRWVENYKPDGSMMNIEAKHKLASDIMNYHRRMTASTIIEALEAARPLIVEQNTGFDVLAGEVIKKIDSALQLINQKI